MRQLKAVLVRSEERLDSFRRELERQGALVSILDLEDPGWIAKDHSDVDLLIFFPTFQFSSNCPHAVGYVVDFIKHVHARWPKMAIFPDPKTIDFYNDKYRQYLFLQSRGFPIPETIPLVSEQAVEQADRALKYPMVVKNRYGAGGGSVFQVKNRKELLKYYRLSRFNFWNMAALGHHLGMLRHRMFYWHLIKNKKMQYPFFSPPLLAQRFLRTDRDVRVVVGGGKVVEAHWRIQASAEQWKVNIDGGGIGEWSAFPAEVLDVSVRVAKELETDGWLALDILRAADGFRITEFSPAWHHYGYKEKPSFVYKDDYNVDVPLDVALDLERIIVASLIEKARRLKA